MKKLLITGVLSFFITTCLFSQSRITLQQDKTYSLAKIYTKKNVIYKARSLTLLNDSTISYRNKKTYKKESVSVNDLRSIKIKTGTKVIGYSLYGGGLMALSCLYAWADDPYYSATSGGYAPLITGIILGGFGIGAIVGMATPKWKMVLLPRKRSQNTSFIIKPVIGSQNNYYALNLNFNF